MKKYIIASKQFLLVLSGLCAVLCTCEPAMAYSSAGDVVGKVTVGYQCWFACTGDGAPINCWWHWSSDEAVAPSPTNNNVTIKDWPDMREYTTSFETLYANLGNGSQEALFSDYDQQTVNEQFKWMQQHGCDTVALQRFNPNTSEGPTRNTNALEVMSAAQSTGRKFFIMYDTTGWFAMTNQMIADWQNVIIGQLHLTNSSNYARQNGKPVVAIWGLGYDDSNHPWPAAQCTAVVNAFKNAGCYVIGGVQRAWRTANSSYLPTYQAMNMIQPWLIGSIGSPSDAQSYYTGTMQADQAYCGANGMDYQCTILPGDVSVSGQRDNGLTMWQLFYDASLVGCQGLYISMYDEYGEGNNIAKSAENPSMDPVGGGFLDLDQSGDYCSSDYYLRLTDAGGEMFKGQRPQSSTIPIPTMIGIVGDYNFPSNGCVYRIVSTTSGMALDNGGSLTAGAALKQNTPELNNSDQEWLAVNTGGSYWHFINQDSGMDLDNGGSTTQGTAVVQYTVNLPNNNQEWQVNSAGSGYYNLVCETSGMYLDNEGAFTSGNGVDQWSGASNENQMWALQVIPQSGHYYHLVCGTSGFSLDNGGSTTAGTAVTQWQDEPGNNNQLWQLVYTNGYWKLICQTSGMALDNGGSKTAGATVTQYTSQAGNSNQNWTLVDAGGGFFNLVCETSGMCLDNSGSTSLGTDLTQWTDNPGNINQYWRFEFVK
jgi:hypothetical protein